MMVPLLLASWCLWKTDEPVISPGTWQPLHSADGRPEHRPTAHQASPALPAPAQCVSRLIMGLYTLDLVFLLRLSGGFHRFLSLMRLLPRNLNEQIYMPFSEVFNLKAVYSYLFMYLNYGTD